MLAGLADKKHFVNFWDDGSMAFMPPTSTATHHGNGRVATCDIKGTKATQDRATPRPQRPPWESPGQATWLKAYGKAIFQFRMAE